MNVFERLSSSLAHGIDLNAIARSTLKLGSPTDIEWCLVGLPKFQEHLIRAKYQLDVNARNLAEEKWTQKLHYRYRGTDVHPGVFYNFVGHTLEYWIDPKICRACGGVGDLTIEAKVVVCEFCDGTGRRTLRPYTVMRILGLGRSAIDHTWLARHHDALSQLDDEESRAAAHMMRRLHGR